MERINPRGVLAAVVGTERADFDLRIGVVEHEPLVEGLEQMGLEGAKLNAIEDCRLQAHLHPELAGARHGRASHLHEEEVF
ncbi:hypothetical protein EYF80_042558 [Liparis tanakae]|uniref:Uncharacterized protein n=1 Tax=Liparis tanakae TaxID=230148 RepID=A0A4Z2G275_9TELE|nr:hypothetical protein EYF80_042558 [Liparis tanakae]